MLKHDPNARKNYEPEQVDEEEEEYDEESDDPNAN